MPLMRNLAQLSVALRYRDEINTEVSSASVEWHIDHSLKVINAVFDSLKNSDPSEYKKEENPIKTYVLTKEKIKRGVAEAPKHVLPAANIESGAILESLESAKKAVILIETLPKKSFFKHKSMGMMKRDQAAKFLHIHTLHHLSIINDILSANNVLSKKKETLVTQAN